MSRCKGSGNKAEKSMRVLILVHHVEKEDKKKKHSKRLIWTGYQWATPKPSSQSAGQESKCSGYANGGAQVLLDRSRVCDERRNG
jgi:hypothetical protein